MNNRLLKDFFEGVGFNKIKKQELIINRIR